MNNKKELQILLLSLMICFTACKNKGADSGALLVALFLIPGIGYALYRKPKKIYHNKWLEKLTLKYLQAIDKILHKPKKTIISVVTLFILAIGLSVYIGKDFLPAEKVRLPVKRTNVI